MKVTIRELVPEDAAELISLQYRLDEESAFMLLEPGERQTGIKQAEDMIRSFASAENSALIGAAASGRLAGFLSVRGGSARRNRHSAYIVTGILKEFQGMGLGSALFKELEKWAKETGIIRLELTIMVHNERALALYTKNGFEIEGIKKKSLKVEGNWVDEYYMSRIFPDGPEVM
ncbi:GNAT family N-acetyltransferase [Paenibacillus riograndensis]|uniref:GCN5-related N-acetyltransferase n=1 Tax=Paenibacillus riograndensis SBR5 TaxID=1073571 RepID=A0A0E4HAR8_9BACL|nr:GNAT family protein [Paenibacillus riograndensis]CQR56090.1 GCN5-related N-acetyltransferase [Paenibacillus riograndensis SBR5]